ncbi:MAG: amidohydrolase family protein [Anaerolineales bacterium]
MVKLNRIDTHQHYIPPSYAKWLSSQGIRPGDIDLPEWSKTAALKIMDKHGIQTGILSVSDPGVNLGDQTVARVKAREVNEYAAEVVQSNPSRFGFFATLTLPDVEGSIIELNYAMDECHADGVILLANSRGIYLGDEAFEPLMVELNQRKAIVFVHPGELPGPTIRGIPAFAADFLLDTTRAVVNLVLSGAMDRYPDIKMILAHAGGFVPYTAYRLLLPKLQRATFVKRIALGLNQEQGLHTELAVFRKFYYDIALSASPTVFPSLLSLVGPDHITYGSDWPFAPTAAVNLFNNELDRYPLNDEQRYGINRGSAETIFPRLA